MRTEIQEKWASFVLDLFQCNFTNPALINPKSTGQIIKNQKFWLRTNSVTGRSAAISIARRPKIFAGQRKE